MAPASAASSTAPKDRSTNRSSKRSRPSSTSKSSANASQDFKKRLKAKVGRRAAKPANVTDTSFRSAAVSVRPQQPDAVAADADGPASLSSVLLTSRGKSIRELTTQLQHPAAAVRQSASKGLKDLVSSSRGGGSGGGGGPPAADIATTTATAALLEAHLSSLVPAIAKCCVDEDDGVRALGLDVLSGLLRKLGADSLPSSSLPVLLQPFGVLLMAFVTSALNSLDESIRVDGAKAMELLSMTVPAVVAPHVPAILPTFVRLLQQQQRSVTGNKNEAPTASSGSRAKKKRSKRRKQEEQRSHLALADKMSSTATASAGPTSAHNARSAKKGFSPMKALLSLLETVTQEGNEMMSVSSSYQIITTKETPDAPPDLTIGGWRRPHTSLFVASGGALCRNSKRSCVYPIRSLSDLHHSQTDAEVSPISLPSVAPVPTLTCLNVLEKLRDALIEASQRGTDDDSNNRLRENDLSLLSSDEIETYLCVMKATGVFFCTYGGSGGLLLGSRARPEEDGVSCQQREQVIRTTLQIASLLLECLPFGCDSDVFTEEMWLTADEMNAVLCCTVCAIADACTPADSSNRSDKLNLDKERKIWIKKVASYVRTSMESLSTANSGNDPAGRIPTEMQQKSSLVLYVFRKLVLKTHGRQPLIWQDSRLRTTLIETFFALLFSGDNGNVRPKLSSALARQGFLVGQELIAVLDFDLVRCSEEYGSSVLDLVQSVPHYLAAWDDNYILESRCAVSLLHDVVRRTRMQEDCPTSRLFDQLALDLRKLIDSPSSGQPSALERYPEGLQRSLVSVIILLGRQLSPGTSSLGKMCARGRLRLGDTFVSSSSASFIVQALHSVRKSISMQSYLTFIVESTGFLLLRESMIATDSPASSRNDTAKTFPWKRLVSLDEGLREACSCLIDCGSSKVLPKLQPLVIEWLSKTCSQGTLYSDLLRLRGVLAILAALCLDSTGNDALLFRSLHGIGEEKIVQASVTIIKCTPGVEETGEEDKWVRRAWTRPLVQILFSQRHLISKVALALGSPAADSNNGGPASSASDDGMQVLIDTLDAPQLALLVHEAPIENKAAGT